MFAFGPTFGQELGKKLEFKSNKSKNVTETTKVLSSEQFRN